jgi:hypothetical protein
MSNPFGITLDPAWTEWAAQQEVSETVRRRWDSGLT